MRDTVSWLPIAAGTISCNPSNMLVVFFVVEYLQSFRFERCIPPLAKDTVVLGLLVARLTSVVDLALRDR